jgi:protein CpxP
MIKRILIGIGALAVLIAAGAAWAHGRGGKYMMKQMISARIAEAEDLIEATPQQRAQIEQSKDKILNALESRRQDRRQTHQKLVELLTGDKLTEADLYAVADQHAQEVQDLAKVVVPEIVKVHDILTPAQRQKLAAKAQEMRQKHRERKGGFGGPGE